VKKGLLKSVFPIICSLLIFGSALKKAEKEKKKAEQKAARVSAKYFSQRKIGLLKMLRTSRRTNL
jgi:hypothetical protein